MQQEDQNVRETEIVSTDEGHLSHPYIDLESNSPSFVRKRSYTFGIPSREVQFCRPTHYEHVRNQLKILVYILNKIKTTQVEIKTQVT